MPPRFPDPRPPGRPTGEPTDEPRLELTYPCAWGYTVIGEEETAVRAAVGDIVGALRHSISLSHTSRNGRYRSFHLEVIVASDQERLTIFRRLHEHPDVRFVL